MPNVTYGTTNSVLAQNGANVTCGLPASCVAGSCVVWGIGFVDGQGDVTGTTGITSVVAAGPRSDITGWRQRLYYKILTSGDVTTGSITFQLNSGNYCDVICHRFDNVDPTTPSPAGGASGATGTSAAPAGASCTVSVTGSLGFRFEVNASGTARSGGPPTGMTAATGSPHDTNIWSDYQANLSAGTFGPTTSALSGSDNWAVNAVVLQPVASGGGGSPIIFPPIQPYLLRPRAYSFPMLLGSRQIVPASAPAAAPPSPPQLYGPRDWWRYRRQAFTPYYQPYGIFPGFLASGNLVVPGIASLEAAGTPGLVMSIAPSGVASLEALGVSRLDLSLLLAGLASAEAPGAAVVSPGPVTVSPTGIATGEAEGAAQLNQQVSPAGLASAEAEGTARVDQQVAPAGVATQEGIGAAVVNVGGILVSPTAIDTAEASGTPTVAPGAVSVSPSGVASGEASGTAALALSVAPSGVASAEGTGSATVTAGTLISPSGAASAEAEGTPTMAPGPVSVTPAGLATGESVGAAVINLGGILLQPTGVPSAEAVGALRLDQVVAALDVATGEAVPGPVLVLYAAPTGVASGEAEGTPALGAILAPAGVASTENVPLPVFLVVVSSSGVVSLEQIGTARIDTPVNPPAVGSAEAVPSLVVTLGDPILGPAGVSTFEVVGDVTVVAYSARGPYRNTTLTVGARSPSSRITKAR